jgi:hypothetical protein
MQTIKVFFKKYKKQRFGGFREKKAFKKTIVQEGTATYKGEKHTIKVYNKNINNLKGTEGVRFFMQFI